MWHVCLIRSFLSQHCKVHSMWYPLVLGVDLGYTGPRCGNLDMIFVFFKACFLISSGKITLRRIGDICKGHHEGWHFYLSVVLCPAPSLWVDRLLTNLSELCLGNPWMWCDPSWWGVLWRHTLCSSMVLSSRGFLIYLKVEHSGCGHPSCGPSWQSQEIISSQYSMVETDH